MRRFLPAQALNSSFSFVRFLWLSMLAQIRLAKHGSRRSARPSISPGVVASGNWYRRSSRLLHQVHQAVALEGRALVDVAAALELDATLGLLRTAAAS
jgi:hypothetical protein